MEEEDTEKEKFAAILKAAASATMPENMPDMMSPPLGTNTNQTSHMMSPSIVPPTTTGHTTGMFVCLLVVFSMRTKSGHVHENLLPFSKMEYF